MPFVRTDVVPLGEERWEVRIDESSEDELDAVLTAVERWAADCHVGRGHLLVDDEPVELPTPRGREAGP